MAYIARQIGVNPTGVQILPYNKDTYARHQRAILSHFECTPFSAVAVSLQSTKLCPWFACSFE
jgi:hypothetical protein